MTFTVRHVEVVPPVCECGGELVPFESHWAHRPGAANVMAVLGMRCKKCRMLWFHENNLKTFRGGDPNSHAMPVLRHPNFTPADEALARIKERASKGAFRLSSNEEVQKLQVHINKIVAVLGKDPAKVWISDTSTIDVAYTEENAISFCAKLASDLGVEVHPGELFLDIARRMARKELT